MSISEFLLRWNERPVLWGFVRPWIPARTVPYSWGRLVAFTGLVAALFALVLSHVFGLLAATMSGSLSLLPWIAGMGAEFGACVGLCLGLVSRICWNQRAARLAAAPDSPEATAPWPRRSFLRRAGFGLLYGVLVAFVTPLLLFQAIENVRGAWAWKQMRAELKAKGECYELSCIIPPPVRDEDNFLATPFWQRFLYRQERTANGGLTNIWLHPTEFPGHSDFSLPDEPDAPKHRGIFTKEPTDGRIDLAAWAAQLRNVSTNTGKSGKGVPRLTFPVPPTPGEPAADVLFGLTKFDATLAEFAGAANRPHSRYPVHYEEGFNALLPNLAAVKSGARICQLRATARLAAGDSAGAAADTLLAYRLGESLNEEPLLISQLVRFACDAYAHRALWEGLVAHRWTDVQLAAFQERLVRLDYAGTFIHALEGERALGNQFAESLVGEHNRLRALERMDKLGGDGNGDGPAPLTSVFSLLMPTGWFRQNQIGLLRGYQMILDRARPVMGSTNRAELLTTDFRNRDSADAYLQRIAVNRSPFSFIVGMLLPAIDKATDKAERAQTIAQMAIVACALERHRLAHGTYPAALGELVPAYLAVVPNDWMNGQPFHYERTNDGWFRLWSVGANGKDDKGVYRLERSSDGANGLDWPWPSPVPTREPRLF